jgi:hypothetical protein
MIYYYVIYSGDFGLENGQGQKIGIRVIIIIRAEAMRMTRMSYIVLPESRLRYCSEFRNRTIRLVQLELLSL